MIGLDFLLLGNVQEGPANQPEMLPPSSITNWIMEMNVLFYFFSQCFFQSLVNVALWGFHSFARLEELRWSEDGRDGPQTVPGPVKVSSSLSLPSSHVLRLSRWPVPNAGHPSSRCLNMLCILLQALTRGPRSWGLTDQAWVSDGPSTRCTVRQELGLSPAGRTDRLRPAPRKAEASLGAAGSEQSACSSILVVADRRCCWGAASSTAVPSTVCPHRVLELSTAGLATRSLINIQQNHIPAVSLGWHGGALPLCVCWRAPCAWGSW